eukprot:403376445
MVFCTEKSKLKQFLKVAIFLNSLIINDLSLRKYEDKFSLPCAFMLLLGQKFLSIFIVKVLVQGELPSLRDQSFVFLLGLHFLSFLYFHSYMGNELMSRINKSQYRILFQETFKGYGKALNLMSSVKKALSYETNFIYFIGVLVIRGSASALFKASMVKIIIKQDKIDSKKARSNFYWNTCPTIVVYAIRRVKNRTRRG